MFAIVLGAIACLAAVAYDLLIRGPMLWHVRQESAWQGGLEVMFLMASCVSAALVPKVWVRALAMLVALLYLRRHNAELTLLVGGYYVLTLTCLGMRVERWLGVTRATVDWPYGLVMGLSLWMALSLLLSAFWLSTPQLLAVVGLVLGLLVVPSELHRAARNRERRSLMPYSPLQRVLIGMLVAWVLSLMARSGYVVGYDTIWYLGQGDRLLAPSGSIFQSLALVSPVHYFPKLWEVLLLPLTVFDQIRIQEGLAIWVLIVFAVLFWRIADVVGLDRTWRWLLLWIVLTLPAVANTGLTLKTDMLTACFLAWGSLHLLHWLLDRRISALGHLVVASALACSTKLTAIPYVALLWLFLAAAEVWRFRHADRPGLAEEAASETRAALMVMAIALTVGLVLLYRTWWLTGMPTIGPDHLFAIWQALGMSLADPVGTLTWTRPQNWSEVPVLLRDWLFLPSTMAKMPISWTGNAWFLFAVVAGLAALLGRTTKHQFAPRAGIRLLFLLSFLGLVLAAAWQYHSRGSDGNYFMFAVSIALLLSLRALAGRLHRVREHHALIVVGLVIGAFHGYHSFISAAWSQPGTRLLDLQLDIAPLQAGQWRQQRLQSAGLSQMELKLRSAASGERGLSFGFGQEPLLLPIAMEDVLVISYSRPDYTVDSSTLFEYIERFDIRHLVLANDLGKDDRVTALHQASQAAGWHAFQDEGGVLYSRDAARPE